MHSRHVALYAGMCCCVTQMTEDGHITCGGTGEGQRPQDLWKGQESCVCLRWQAARKAGLTASWEVLDGQILDFLHSAKSKWSRLAFSSGSYIGGSIKARRQLFILGAMHYHWRIVKEERDCQKRKEGFTINAAGSCLGELDFIPVYDMGYYFMLWNHLNQTFPTCL